MRITYPIILIIILLTLIITGCDNQGDEQNNTEIAMPESGIYVSIEPNEISFENLESIQHFSMLITNLDNEEVSLRQDYNLYMLDGEEWVGVPFNRVDFYPSLVLASGETETMYWSSALFPIPGTYRLLVNDELYGELTITK